MKTGLVVFAILLGIGGFVVFVAFQQTVAEHLGYALPGGTGLPHRLSYAGRDYMNEHPNDPSTCTSSAELRASHYWPLRRVGTLPTLFGASHPILRAPTPRGMTTMGLYIPTARDCIVPYTLLGGP